MTIDPKAATKLDELKKKIEEMTGREVPATAGQLGILCFPEGPGVFTDVRIEAFSWDANGAAAANVTFDRRCWVVSSPIIV